MKEMLFIMVAILVPPTLTYLGFVGESHAQRMEEPVRGLSEQADAGIERASLRRTDEGLCWQRPSSS